MTKSRIIDESGRKPKYKNGLRQAITAKTKEIKNVEVLRSLYIISDLMQRRYDDEACQTLTEEEIYTFRIIMDVLSCHDAKLLRSVRAFIRAYFSDK